MEYDFGGQFEIGKQGVEILKGLTAGCIDYLNDMDKQKRGIDLFIPGVGYVEVKTDTTEYENVFLEVDTEGRPGGIFNSRADWLYMVFIKQGVVFSVSLPRVQHWLAQHYGLLNSTCRRTIVSRRGKARWTVGGFIVSRAVLVEEIGAKEETYAE